MGSPGDHLFLPPPPAIGTLLELVLHVTEAELVDGLGVRLRPRLVDDAHAGDEEAVVLEERLQVDADPPAGDEAGVAAGRQPRRRLPGEGEQAAHPSAGPGPAPVERLEGIGGIGGEGEHIFANDRPTSTW